MIKKVLFTLLCITIVAAFLVGCSTDTTPSVSPTLPLETTETTSAPPAPSATAQPLDKNVQSGSVSYSVPSSWREVVSDDKLSVFYYPYEENADGYIGLVTANITSEIETSPNAMDDILMGMKSSFGTSDFASEKLSVNGIDCTKCMYLYDDDYDRGAYSVISYVFMHDKKLYNFVSFEPPSPLSEPAATFEDVVNSIGIIVPDDDFLKEKDTRSQLFSLANNYNFDGILDLANAYIETNTPPESDTVYQFVALAEEADMALQNCSIVADDFEETVTVYGSSVESISKNTNIVPYLEGYSLMVKLGFKASDWIFFEKVAIKVNDGEYVSFYFDHFDVARDINNGISEIATTSIKEEKLAQIVNADAPVMRFTGDDGKTRDHELTSEEISACSAILNLSLARSAITDSINNWMEENDISKF